MEIQMIEIKRKGFHTETSTEFALFVNNHPFVLAVSRLITFDRTHCFSFPKLVLLFASVGWCLSEDA